MRRSGFAIIIPAFLILLVASSGFASAQEWEPQEWNPTHILLQPGDNIVVNFTNTHETSVYLTIEEGTAPSELVSSIMSSPENISVGWIGDVYIAFILDESVRPGITPGYYTVTINGASSKLLVTLDMTGNSGGIPCENYDSQIAALESTVNDLMSSVDSRFATFEEWVDDFLARIEALENAPAENWIIAFEDLRAEWENFKNTPYENSGNNFPENLDNLKEAVVEGVIEYINITVIPQLKLDLREDIAKTELKSENNTIYGAIFSVVVVIAAIIVSGKFGGVKKLFKTSIVPHQRQTQVGLDDQIAMLENQISAMRDRGESEDAIKKKELELEYLKKRRDLEKPKELETPVEKKSEVE